MKTNAVKDLINKGVTIHNPETVFISDDIDIDRISGENVTIYSGCKIIGSRSLILKGSTIGYEAPVTLENSVLGKNSNLKGGFFQDAVFAGDNVFGSGAHVRKGTILEEQSNAAHSVALKQTILFPYVTLGSLINFCDCLMSGGTSRKDHSEVGSSFIHFNYTPNQDKATPSIMGNIYEGVMLDKEPIFLGGQGGLVGPCRIAFGCTTAAGSIIRKDELKEDRLLFGGSFKEISFPIKKGIYNNINRTFNNNIYYIASLLSLLSWYKHIRVLFGADFFTKELIREMNINLLSCIEERIQRLSSLIENLKNAIKKDKNKIKTYEKIIKNFLLADKKFETYLKNIDDNKPSEKVLNYFKEQVEKQNKDYIQIIKNITSEISNSATTWLYESEQKIIKDIII